jgi:hypothetical protein|uniref:Uncharacterized protein n=1 Tax=Siphoviridae sp. ctMOb8 TaxID=2825460 RepID=A0A8S5Q0D4_9CAUD|nr:MAG TPA: hypothetical protein [Siphoviridae sp. ctMOb8]
MKRVYILNTCDERKSWSSFHLYGIWASSKAGTRRLVNAIIAGIEKYYFSYEDKYMDIAQQIESLREDAKTDCNTFYSLLSSKLIYGSIELVEIQ